MDTSLQSALVENLIIKTKIAIGFLGVYLFSTLATILWVEESNLFNRIPVWLLFLIPVLSLILIGFEISVLDYLKKVLSGQKTYKKGKVYVAAYLEILYPTILVFCTGLIFLYPGTATNEGNVANSSHTFLYIIFIILSAFYFDFKLSSGLGILSGLQYVFIIFFYLDYREDIILVVPLLMKSMYMVLFGVGAGYVSMRIKNATTDALESKNILINQLDIKVKERTIELQEQKELVEEKNKEITDSIEYAKRIQKAILPPLPMIQTYLDTFILYRPKDIVAGDFYWFHHEGDEVYFSAADCTGHGVPGAMVSVVCSNAYNKSVRELGLREPNEILDKTRELVINTLAEGSEEVKDGMDVCFCRLNIKTNKLIFSGAFNSLFLLTKVDGNEGDKDLVLNNLKCVEYKGDRQPIGKNDFAKPFTQHEIQLKKGDSFYISSDGYPDQFGGPETKKLNSKGMKKILLNIQNQSMSEQHDSLLKAFEDWKGNEDQIDDVIVMGVRV